jgi:Na+/H+ antiporter NhaD/arsenite permease-like protein
VNDVSVYSSLILVLPFTLLLLAIAVMPLASPHLWENNRNKAILTAVVASPVAVWLALNAPYALAHSAAEYFSFLSLLGSLFVVSGGIHIAGDVRGTPGSNVVIMAVGAVLSNLIGTTGASMVLIRLLLRTNSQRKHTAHLPLFFILLVSNCGGLLTPIGDPPLFLGYLRGVPFFWTLRLFPLWLIATGYLCLLLWVVDNLAYRRETASDLALDDKQVEPVRLTGWVNVALLAALIGAVFLPMPYREAAMLSLAAGSLLGSKQVRSRNEFSFAPILEVAILFAGIFVTMVPALQLLQRHGASLGLTEPWQYFAVTGTLSSVLDNAPTYLTFLATAQGLGFEPAVAGMPHAHLFAISAGAVLMGANTYIGNGPNFMVKAIAESRGYVTYGFVGYALRAILILLPVYTGVILYLM